jgi:hypothetical protein
LAIAERFMPDLVVLPDRTAVTFEEAGFALGLQDRYMLPINRLDRSRLETGGRRHSCGGRAWFSSCRYSRHDLRRRERPIQEPLVSRLRVAVSLAGGAGVRSRRSRRSRASVQRRAVFVLDVSCNGFVLQLERSQIFNIGIYHLQGCPSYPAITMPQRWFCAEDDARAAGFRRAYNCQAGKGK